MQVSLSSALDPSYKGSLRATRQGHGRGVGEVAEVCPCSGHENRGAFEPTGAEIGEGLVGLIERIACGLGNDADLRHLAQEIDAVLPREIGD